MTVFHKQQLLLFVRAAVRRSSSTTTTSKSGSCCALPSTIRIAHPTTPRRNYAVKAHPVMIHSATATAAIPDRFNTSSSSTVPNYDNWCRWMSTTSSASSNNNNSKKPKSIYLKACWTDNDLEEGDIVKASFDLEDIREQAVDLFGMADDLEFYDGEDWRKLDDLDELLDYYEALTESSSSKAAATPPIPIRVPSLFDEEYGHENDLVKMRKMTPEMMQQQQQQQQQQKGPSKEQLQLKQAITSLHDLLLDVGYTRASPDTLQKRNAATDDETAAANVVRTRDWVLERAARDTFLRSVLLSQPRALRHISETLHYDFLWNHPDAAAAAAAGTGYGERSSSSMDSRQAVQAILDA